MAICRRQRATFSDLDIGRWWASRTMATKLYWMHSGSCGGDTMAFLNTARPDVPTLLQSLDVELLWHPSLSNLSPKEHVDLLHSLQEGETPLDVLVVEGPVIRGPAGTGMFDARGGRPRRDLVAALARKAGHVIALGTCASFGGFGVGGEIDATGLQFTRTERGGLLGADFRSGSGMPVINLSGCPCHHDVLGGTLMTLLAGAPPQLDEFQRPLEWYGMTVHQGCTRNEYHEYRVEEESFGDRGCLFFHMGCHGPLASGPCNKHLWNGQSSKTRAGVPCFGCTSPDFPPAYPFFYTRNIEGIPLALPKGVNRAHYMAYKVMAAAAAPQRLKNRDTEV
jgi:hydrogenase small subunit